MINASPMYDIITIGSATRDVFMRSKQIRIIEDTTFSTGEASCLALGSKIDIDEVVFETGGGATNTAVGFQRLGMRTAFIGRIGYDDGRGREVLRELAREGVATSLVVRDRHDMTAYSVLLLTSRGERTVLIYRGASAKFSVGELPWRSIRCKWLYVTALAGNYPLLTRLFSYARTHDIKVAWNPGAAELALGYAKLLPLLRQASMVSMNREEASRLLKIDYAHEGEAFDKLCAELSGIVVITEGTKGARACYQGVKYRSGIHRIKVVDTTGAGDAFGCGFIGTYMKTNGDIVRSLQFATANAESVLQKIGAKAGLLKSFPRKNRVPVTVFKA